MATEWIVENLLPRVGVAILSGHPGVGKTHVINDLMASCATGTPLQGMRFAGSAVPCCLQPGAPRRPRCGGKCSATPRRVRI